MPDTPVVTVMLELHVGATPITGWLRVGEHRQTSFRGWLELTSLLEAAAGGGLAEPTGADGVMPPAD